MGKLNEEEIIEMMESGEFIELPICPLCGELTDLRGEFTPCCGEKTGKELFEF